MEWGVILIYYLASNVNIDPPIVYFYCWIRKITYTTFNLRAAAYTQIHKYNEAIADCKKSIEIDPNYAKAYSRHGLVLYALGKYKEALVIFHKGNNCTSIILNICMFPTVNKQDNRCLFPTLKRQIKANTNLRIFWHCCRLCTWYFWHINSVRNMPYLTFIHIQLYGWTLTTNLFKKISRYILIFFPFRVQV